MADHEFPSSPIYYSSSLLYDKKKTSKDVKEQKEMAMEGRAIAMALKSKDKK